LFATKHIIHVGFNCYLNEKNVFWQLIIVSMKLAHSSILDNIRKCVPYLSTSLKKGDCGKIGVLGGCFEYTGAPYYAAISSLKVGSDLAHIFCAENAAIPIKSYSPEIVVHPVLKESQKNELHTEKEDDEIVNSVTKWFHRSVNVLVIGPGLGRDPRVMNTTKKIILEAKKSNLPLVIDGDGLHLISIDPDIIRGYSLAILTPNANEYLRLCASMKLESNTDVCQLAKSFDNVTIVKKGPIDTISDGSVVLECTEVSSGRRCGGQGDILAGSIAAFFSWTKQHWSNSSSESETIPSLTSLAAYGGCVVTRASNRNAFGKHLRSTTTPNIIEEIGNTFEALFPCHAKL